MSRTAATPPYDVVLVDNLEIVRTGAIGLQLSHPNVIRTMRAYTHVNEIDLNGRAPDVLVLDYWLGNDDETSLTYIAALQHWGAPVLLYTTEKTPVRLQEAHKAGVDGVCLKMDGNDALVEAIDTVARGGFAVSSASAQALLSDQQLQARLTPREQQVLRGLEYGLTHAEIAERLVIAPSTVGSHVENVRSKYADSSGRRVSEGMILFLAMRDGYTGRPDAAEDPEITG